MKRLCNGVPIDKDIPEENILKQLEDIAIHKQYIIEESYKLSKYFFKKGKAKLALNIMKRAFSHDASKLREDEFYGMAKFAYNVESLKDPNEDIADFKQKYINLHWDRNSHHPEYWTEISEMENIDICELVCDWNARSRQMNTDVFEFLKTRQEDRFHFPQDIYDKIHYYLTILNELNEKEDD